MTVGHVGIEIDIAFMVDNIVDYKWSSYRERCLLSEPNIIDDIRDTLKRDSGTD